LITIIAHTRKGVFLEFQTQGRLHLNRILWIIKIENEDEAQNLPSISFGSVIIQSEYI